MQEGKMAARTDHHLIMFGSWLGVSLCNLPLLSGSGDGKPVTPSEQQCRGAGVIEP